MNTRYPLCRVQHRIVGTVFIPPSAGTSYGRFVIVSRPPSAVRASMHPTSGIHLFFASIFYLVLYSSSFVTVSSTRQHPHLPQCSRTSFATAISSHLHFLLHAFPYPRVLCTLSPISTPPRYSLPPTPRHAHTIALQRARRCTIRDDRPQKRRIYKTRKRVLIGFIYPPPGTRPYVEEWAARLGLLSVFLLGCLGWQACAMCSWILGLCLFHSSIHHL